MEPTIKILGKIVNGEFKSYRPGTEREFLLQHNDMVLARYYVLHEEQKTVDQLGYLMGGIIRVTMMNTDTYAGWTHDECLEHLVDQCATVWVDKRKIVNGKETYVSVPKVDRISRMSKARLTRFIDDVLDLLAKDNIIPLTPEEYLTGKYSSLS